MHKKAERLRYGVEAFGVGGMDGHGKRQRVNHLAAIFPLLAGSLFNFRHRDLPQTNWKLWFGL